MAMIERVTFKPLGAHRAIAVDSDVDTLVIDEDNATLVMVQVETDEVRFTLDGTTPVAGSTGFILRATDPVFIVDVERGVTFTYTKETDDAVLQYQFGQGAG